MVQSLTTLLSAYLAEACNCGMQEGNKRCLEQEGDGLRAQLAQLNDSSQQKQNKALQVGLRHHPPCLLPSSCSLLRILEFWDLYTVLHPNA